MRRRETPAESARVRLRSSKFPADTDARLFTFPPCVFMSAARRSSAPPALSGTFCPVYGMLSSQISGTAAGKSASAVLMNSGVRSGFAGMLGGNPGSRGGVRAGNASLLGLGQGMVGRFEPDKAGPPHGCSGSDMDSDSGDEDELAGRRVGGVKRERAEMEAAMVAQEAGLPSLVTAGAAGAKPGKKTRGRVKIKMEFIDNKLRRYTTFSKRKTGIMKKAYELSTLTGTQVLLLVASETGHVYTFATRKLQPMITSETGKALIQTCLNSPDSPPRSDPSTDQRMSATGFEETDLTYQVSESESLGETKDSLKPTFTVASLPGSSSSQTTVPTTSTSMQVTCGPTFPITNYLAPISAGASCNSIAGANGTVLKSAGASGGVMQIPGGFTFMSGTPFAPGTSTIPLGQLQQHSLALQSSLGQTASSALNHPQQNQQAVFRLPATVSLAGGAVPHQLQTIQVQPSTQSGSISTSDSGPESSTASTVSLPATIVTSSVPTSMAGHMMYSSPHTVMYASAPTLTDGGLAVLNAFSQGPSAMQVSHAQSHDTGGVSQVFLTASPGTVQIPVSAVQLHPVRQDQHFTNGDWSTVQRQQ
ncbi:serum response factor b isoform X2 [Triplophysa rosa]|uniref:serum response factor b isoform X2 n=1 Tax=Triplophysa rosa TaxID=992332 RepID=UPI002545C98F|nr:serum response factor b isoform X2 [Triplophysa rosa]